MNKKELARIIDHTAIKPFITRYNVEKLCHEAIQYGFGLVCVAPCWITFTRKALGTAHPHIKIGSVVGFPHGNTLTASKQAEAMRVVEEGVDEIDMVMNLGWFISKFYNRVVDDIAAVVEQAKSQKNIIVKVIIEAPLLKTDDEKRCACNLVVKAGADFVKTSTGFYESGAAVHDVRLMHKTVGSQIGVKAAGGIRDYKTAVAMVKAGATRLGCSQSVHIVSS